MSEFTEDNLIALKLQLRKRSPFFSVLALYANHQLDESIPTACTDGKTIWYSPAYMGSLDKEGQLSVMLHETMHMALQHIPRRGDRDPKVSNMSADYALNLLLRDSGFVIPEGWLIDDFFLGMCEEEIYLYLMQNPDKQPQMGEDLLDLMEGAEVSEETEEMWKQALKNAATTARMAGSLPAGLEKYLDNLEESQIPWQQKLADFVVRTSDDFSGYERRSIYLGMYEDALLSEKLNIAVAGDTSGSMSNEDLRDCVSEVNAIVQLYPSTTSELYWFDGNISGPHELTFENIIKPIGGGGTSLMPLWAHFKDNDCIPQALVIFTDGYMDLSQLEELCPTMWVLTPGGAREEEIPFGEVVRLV